MPVMAWLWVIVDGNHDAIFASHRVYSVPMLIQWLCSDITDTHIFCKVKCFLPLSRSLRNNYTKSNQGNPFLRKKVFHFRAAISRHINTKRVFKIATHRLTRKCFNEFHSGAISFIKCSYKRKVVECPQLNSKFPSVSRI